jgi:hypothetical protein
MASLIGNELYPCVLGSRTLGGYATKGGMLLWRYAANRFLTYSENLLFVSKLSEFHTGYRAFSRDLLERLPLEANSNDFLFDNQRIAEILWLTNTIGEVSCPTRCAAKASSINFTRSVKYGLGCLWTGLVFRLARMDLVASPMFPAADVG